METKVCKRCNREVDIKLFRFHRETRDKLQTWCNECKNEYSKKYNANNKEKTSQCTKDWQENNKEHYVEYKKKYREEHKIVIHDKNKKYREDNKDMISKRFDRYRKENKEKISERNKKFAKENKELVNVKSQRRRAIKRKLSSSLTVKQWNQVKLYFNNYCCYCGEEKTLTQEHFIALTKGGEYTINNIIPVCQNCNSRKNTKDFFEWYPQQTFYNKKKESNILKYLNYNNKVQQLSICN